MQIKLLASMMVGLSATALLFAPSQALAKSFLAYRQLRQTTLAAATAPPQPLEMPILYPQIVANPLSYQTVVNKKFQLASSFAPSDLRQPNVIKAADEPLRTIAADALEHMFTTAASQGVPLRLTSAYRSFDQQRVLHDAYIQIEGLGSAEASSARPGYSEHQTGLAADFGAVNVGQTAAANTWVAANGHNYGFIIRYPASKEQITGYQYEPWHIRYVGLEAAKALYGAGQTMEEYFKVPGGGYAQ